MLEGLDSIDWSNLSHAYGAATIVPRLIRQVASRDQKERDEAISHLFSTIYHQGTIYDSSPHAVPFLIELLESEETPDRASIAYLLACIANGSGNLQVHAFYGIFVSQAVRHTLVEQGRDLQIELAKETAWVNATRDAIGQKLELLYPYLQHREWYIREAVTLALVHYPDRARVTLPMLWRALRSESEPNVRKWMKRAIAEIQRRAAKLRAGCA